MNVKENNKEIPSGRSKEKIVSYTTEELMAMRTRRESHTDWKRVDAIKDEGLDYSDIPELDDDFFKRAKIRWPRTTAQPGKEK